MRIRIFGFTIKAFRGNDALDALRRCLKASEGKDRYIKRLEMSLDRYKALVTNCSQCREPLIAKSADYTKSLFSGQEVPYCPNCYKERMKEEQQEAEEIWEGSHSPGSRAPWLGPENRE